MTDAREIIAQEFRQAHRDTCYPYASDDECEIAASVIVASLTAAGFRIIGPDEVDQVVEAAQAVIDRWDTPAWKDAEPTADAINRLRRAIGRKA